jgi:hypothetical protein
MAFISNLINRWCKNLQGNSKSNQRVAGDLESNDLWDADVWDLDITNNVAEAYVPDPSAHQITLATLLYEAENESERQWLERTYAYNPKTYRFANYSDDVLSDLISPTRTPNVTDASKTRAPGKLGLLRVKIPTEPPYITSLHADPVTASTSQFLMSLDALWHTCFSADFGRTRILLDRAEADCTLDAFAIGSFSGSGVSPFCTQTQGWTPPKHLMYCSEFTYSPSEYGSDLDETEEECDARCRWELF